jgi:pimeloyl-ACP methyl ester carboxylesterase
MDQRGTGRSKPVVFWPSPAPLPPDVFSSETTAIEHIRQAGKQAVEYFKNQGFDLSGYNTVESADDLEALRQALGAPKISLIGFSYGTHLALALIRRHAAQLEAAVLVGTEGSNHTLKLPSTYDHQLRRISDLAASDPKTKSLVPDMVALLQRVLARLEKEPISLTIKDRRRNQDLEVQVGKFGLQLIIRLDAGDGNDFVFFPALLYGIEQGDYSILKRYVEKRYNQLSRGISGMAVMMDLFSGATADRISQIKEEAKLSLLGNVMNFPDMYIAEIWGKPDLGDDYRSPISTATRTLFISGTMDSNTPPFQAEEVRKGFSNSIHLVIEHAGHEDMLPNEQVRKAIVDFLAGKDVSQIKIAAHQPKFEAIR